MTDNLLTDREFQALSIDDQAAYLNLAVVVMEGWNYTPVQQVAERLSQEADEILYGGAAGGGKSDWLLHHTHDLSLRVPGHRSLLLRRTFPELQRSLIQRSVLRINQADAHYNIGQKEWRYKNGSVIEFGHLDADEDVQKYLSAEYDFIGFDEASQFTEWQITMVSSRCRTTVVKRGLGARPHVAMATNPGGASHGYLKRRFVKATDFGARTYIDVNGRNVAFVPAKVADNPFIDPTYEKWLMALPEVERRQYLYGDWDVFAGQYFGEFDRAIHVVDPFTIPDSWYRVRGIDYGWTHPFACIWIAFDNDGNAVVYRELEQTKMTPGMQARMVRAMTGAERIQATVADPSAFGRHNGVEKPTSVQWSDNGLVCARATNARVTGWTNIREYLHVDSDGKPGVTFFATCNRTIETLTELVHDRTKVEDAAAGDDHLPDALRYALAVRPRTTAAAKKPAPATLQERVWAHMQRKKRERPRMTPQGVI